MLIENNTTPELDRRQFLALSAAAAVVTARPSRPNILVVRADQLRIHSLGCYGDAQAATPNIDALAAESTKFTRCYSTEPTCNSHRVVFDVGKHGHALTNKNKLHPKDQTLHGSLQEAGYYTFHIGKWHKTPRNLRMDLSKETVPIEILRGLDYHAGHERQHEQVNSSYWKNGKTGAKSAGPWRATMYEQLAEERMLFAQGKGKPFYGVLDLEAPHGPLKEIEGTRWDVFDPAQMILRPNVPAAKADAARSDYARYYGMTSSIDEQVGDVMTFLGTNGLLASTLVFFTSDHGGHVGSHGYVGSAAQKLTMYDEAVRVPLLFRDGSGAGESDELVGTVDFMPWILKLAGVDPSPGLHGFQHVPGSLYFQELFAGTEAGPFRGVVRDDGMKYARAEGTAGPWILFDGAADPFDQFNLVGTDDPREAEMDELLHEAADAVGDHVPW